MKVLQVNCVYRKGSTGKIVYDIHKELKKRGIDSVVCYGRGKNVKEDNVYKTCTELYSKVNQFIAKLTGVMYGGCFFSTRKLISIIKKEKPDVVHLHCINGYFVNIYRLINWLKKENIKTVLTLHAEFMYTANCGYAFECEKWKTGCGNCERNKSEIGSFFFDNTHLSWEKMKKAFDGFENLSVISVSEWLMNRAKNSPIMADLEHQVVLNGVETQVFKLYEHQKIDTRSAFTDKIVFHATPTFNDDPNYNKGGYYVIELAKEMKDVQFIVAGEYKDGLIVPSNITLLGKVVNQTELSRCYSTSDVTLLTSKRETFSMVTAESLCCGTPVVGFRAGAPEQISILAYSEFVEYGNLLELKNALSKALSEDWDKARISREAKEKYDKQKMIDRYLMFYESER